MIEPDPERRAAAAQVAAAMEAHAQPDARFDRDFSWFIPGFADAAIAAERVVELASYRAARTLFVTPDNGLAPLRAAAIRDRKTLVLPTYGLRRGFVRIDGAAIDPALATYASWLDGLEQFGRPVSLEALASEIRIDLVVTAAAAISTAGQRFGMGSSYLDLEYPILSRLGCTSDATPIVAIAHDAQVWPATLRERATDICADVIVTPTAIHPCPSRQRPTAIRWELVDPNVADEPYFAALRDL